MDQKKYEIIKNNQGFIAALDQSGGSSSKTLKEYGIDEDNYTSEEEMFDLIHEMRKRIIKSPSFSSEYILGTILFKKTMESKVDDEYTADYLWNKKGIVSFLKIDNGLAEMSDGVQMMKPIDNLDSILEDGLTKHVFGTKMRSVIKEDNEKGIEAVVNQQFDLAKKIIAKGLVPIIEPEVDINAKNKQRCEEILKKYVDEQLKTLNEQDKVMFKFTLPTINNYYEEYTKHPNVIRVLALSGGYSREEANKILAQNNNLIASFSRALLEGLNINQSEEEFNEYLLNSIKSIYKASTEKN